MDKEYAQYLLEKTRQDYNLIAEDFSRTRNFLPEDIKSLGEYAQDGDRILDLGCGNGRFYGVLESKNVDFYGIDFSEKLIKIAKEKYPQAKFRIINALNLPFPENYFDKIYSISVLHNIPSREFQLQYLKEARRILKGKGLLILRVWDFWKRKEGLRAFFKYTILKLIGKSKLDLKDVFLPWKDSKGKVLIQRYFHCFTKKEILGLAKQAGFKIKEIWREGENLKTNICLVAEK